MRHDPASAAVVVMLRGLKMYGMAQAVSDLVEQAEGQITRLKLIKRQMYGRAKLDLLQARLVGAET